jgi:hypothetical protein
MMLHHKGLEARVRRPVEWAAPEARSKVEARPRRVKVVSGDHLLVREALEAWEAVAEWAERQGEAPSSKIAVVTTVTRLRSIRFAASPKMVRSPPARTVSCVPA